jgi:release factor glutamine methyltransferase
MTLRSALTSASASIARRDAETLLAHLLQRDRAYLFAHPEAELSEAEFAAFAELTNRRAAHEPLQHLTGQQEFFGLTLRVTPDTLIPRPETELLVESVLAWARTQASPLNILDIGTGTGAIALALATHLPAAHLTATDLAPAALEVARHNAASFALTTGIRFLESDLLTSIPSTARFDAIVSNPPYIPLTDAPTLASEVVDHEPHTALFAGPDGLDIYRRLIPAAHAALRPNGLLALEFGFGQREALRALLEAAPCPWHSIRFLDDYAAIPRVALALRGAESHA